MVTGKCQGEKISPLIPEQACHPMAGGHFLNKHAEGRRYFA